jgi:hypothetical protein
LQTASDYAVFQRVLDERTEELSYPDYLDQIQSNAVSVSVLFAEDSFAVKNAQKTSVDYQPLSDVQLTSMPSYGVNGFLKMTATEYLLFMASLFLCFFYVVRDRECGMYAMLCATKKGHRKLLVGRLKCVCCHMTMVMLLLYVQKAVFYAGRYGFYDLSRSIQSVYQMKDCSLLCNVGQYLALFLVVRWCAFLVFTVLFYHICIWVCQPVGIIVVTVLVGLLEVLFYYRIEASMSLAFLKWLNLYSFCFTDDLLRRYINLSVFGNPVSARRIAIVLVGIVLTGGVAGAHLGYRSLREHGRRKCRLLALLHKRPAGGNGHSLVVWELHKLLVQQRVWVVVVAFAIVMAVTFQPKKIYYGDLEEAYYKKFMTQWEGVLTADKERAIEEQQTRYEDAIERLMNVADADTVQMAVLTADLDGQTAYERVLRRYDNAKQRQWRALVYDTGYEWLLGGRGRNYMLALTAFLYLVLLLSLSGMFSFDRMNQMDAVLYTTQKGVRQVNRCKWWIAFAMYSLYFTVVFGARLLGVGMVYGYPQLGASAGSLVCLSVNVDGISIAGLLFLVHLAYYLLGALVLVLCMMISKKSVSLMQSILLSLLAGVFVWAGLWYASSLFMLY